MQQDPKVAAAAETLSFIERNGSFGVLVVVFVLGAIALFFVLRWLGRLLSKFLVGMSKGLDAMNKSFDAMVTQQTRTNDVLEELARDTKILRTITEKTAATVVPWGDPEWLKSRLERIEGNLHSLQIEVARVSAQLAVALAGRVVVSTPASTSPASPATA